MRRSSCPSVVRANGGKPPPPPSRSSVASSTAVVVRESMCELAYDKDELTDSMKGKLKQAFKLPSQDPAKIQSWNPDLRRKSLGVAKRPSSWTPGAFTAPMALPLVGPAMPAEEEYTFEELVLWRPPEPEIGESAAAAAASPPAPADGAEGSDAAVPAPDAPAAPAAPETPATAVSVDGFLCRWLREHQREGVQFLFDCCMGLRDFDGMGCILADDMGLGKTLQSIAILWTLMTQGMDGRPAVTHTIVACPVSLVTNWESELNTKWIKEARLRAKGIQVIAVAEAKKEDVLKMVRRFTTSPSAVLIISYETFRIHQKLFKKGQQCGLLICDEAHRLKNKDTKTAQALASLPTRKRILLSGTPIQNALDEFYSMVHFANPDLLGSEKDFCRQYQRPILRGREPDATDKERERGETKSSELGKIVNQFILRRTNTLLSKHLPPKLVCVVCCSMSQLQTQMYRQFLDSKATRLLVNGGKQSMVLESINSLRKLINHPLLVSEKGKASKGFEDAIHLLPDETISDRRSGSRPVFDPSLGGKFSVLHQLLRYVKATSSDRFVLVSNFTSTLELMERMCMQEGWKSCRLDGSCSIKKRTQMVEEFNDPRGGLFCFLLSSKAGGCGLNLIGGNRLVMFDPDWNPANDKQAAARVWRDGQKKRVFIYRMIAASCIEEKIFERQLSKEGLSGIATNEDVEVSTFSSSQLRDLFSYHEGVPSHLYDKIKDDADAAERAPDGPANSLDEPSPSQELPLRQQNGWPKETGDMHLWAHHSTASSVDDEALRRATRHSSKESGGVSFVFSLHVKGKDLKKARAEEEEERRRQAVEDAELAAKEKEARRLQSSATPSSSSSLPPLPPPATALGGKENSQPVTLGGSKLAFGKRPLHALGRRGPALPAPKAGPGAAKQRAPPSKAKAKQRRRAVDSDEESEEEESEEEESEDDESASASDSPQSESESESKEAPKEKKASHKKKPAAKPAAKPKPAAAKPPAAKKAPARRAKKLPATEGGDDDLFEANPRLEPTTEETEGAAGAAASGRKGGAADVSSDDFEEKPRVGGRAARGRRAAPVSSEEEEEESEEEEAILLLARKRLAGMAALAQEDEDYDEDEDEGEEQQPQQRGREQQQQQQESEEEEEREAAAVVESAETPDAALGQVLNAAARRRAKKSQRQQAQAAAVGGDGEDGESATLCKVCGLECGSRNKLFQHIKANPTHAVLKEQPARGKRR